MLGLNKVTKFYGNSKGCENITFNVNKSEVVGFIGPNGSGKSTTIRSIMKYLKINSGSVLINNKIYINKDYSLKEKIGYLPSEINLYENMKVKEIINYNNNFYKKDCVTKALEFSKKLDLNINKKIKELSMGNLKKIGIVLSLMHEPDLIILDEPTNGLDPLIQEKFIEIIKEEKKRGAAILFSTHILSDVNKVCDRVILIKKGNIIEELAIEKEGKQEVIIKSKKDVNHIKRELKNEKLNIKDNVINFEYDGDINKLLKILNKYTLDSLIIENKLFEDKLIEYYKGEE